MNNICICNTIVLLQDIMPLVSSMDICPGTWLTQYYQSWRLGHEIKHNSPAEYCRPQKRFQWDHLLFFTQRLEEARQSANCLEVDSHKSVGLRSNLYTKGWSAQCNQKTDYPYPHKCWVTLAAPLYKLRSLLVPILRHGGGCGGPFCGMHLWGSG